MAWYDCNNVQKKKKNRAHTLSKALFDVNYIIWFSLYWINFEAELRSEAHFFPRI